MMGKLIHVPDNSDGLVRQRATGCLIIVEHAPGTPTPRIDRPSKYSDTTANVMSCTSFDTSVTVIAECAAKAPKRKRMSEDERKVRAWTTSDETPFPCKAPIGGLVLLASAVFKKAQHHAFEMGHALLPSMQARADTSKSVRKAIAILDNPRGGRPKREDEPRKAGRKRNFTFKFDKDIVAARLKYPKIFSWWVMWQSYVELHPDLPKDMQPSESIICDYMKRVRAMAARSRKP